MCNFRHIVCNKCLKKGKNTVELCNRYGDKKMCINKVGNMNDDLDMPLWGIVTLNLGFRYFVEIPGMCFPRCPSEIMVPDDYTIRMANTMEEVKGDINTTQDDNEKGKTSQ